MTGRVLLATDDTALFTLVRQLLREPDETGQQLCPCTLKLAPTASDAEHLLFDGSAPTALLIVDARIRWESGAAEHDCGGALQLLRIINRDRRAPVVVVQVHPVPDLQRFCAQHDVALLVQLDELETALRTCLKPPALVQSTEPPGPIEGRPAAITRVEIGGESRPEPGAAQSSTVQVEVSSEPANQPGSADGVTVEFEIGSASGRYSVVRADGKCVAEGPIEPLNLPRLRRIASSYRRWRVFETVEVEGQRQSRPVSDWRQRLVRDGADVYEELVLSGRGKLWLDLLRAQVGGDWSRVNFRFHVDDEELFSLPLEALFDNQRFIRVYQPIARRVGIPNVQGVRAARPPGTVRTLLIEAPAQGLLQLKDPRGDPRPDLWFDPLSHLERERGLFAPYEGSATPGLRVEVQRLADRGGHASFREALESSLETERFDLIHFAGHSYGTEDDRFEDRRTYLLLPSDESDIIDPMPIGTFAALAGKAGAQFVYLSSCRGSSPLTIRHMVENGVANVLGFRWDVEDRWAPEFAKRFYAQLLKGRLTYGRAYLAACQSLYKDTDEGSQSPIWAAPLLVMQDEDWWQRRVA